MKLSATRRALSAIVVSGLTALLAAPAQAQFVECPTGEPGFPYLDAGNDGCFDMGVDTEILESALFGAPYDVSGSGSIVVPDKSKLTPAAATVMDWTADGIYVRGDIVVDGTPVNIRAVAGDLEILGNITNTGIVPGVGLLVACSGACVEGAVAPKAKLTSTGDIQLEHVSLGEKARVTASGDIDMILIDIISAGVKVQAGNDLSIGTEGSGLIGEKVSLAAIAGILTLDGQAASFAVGSKFRATAANLLIFTGAIASSIGDKAKLEATQAQLSITASSDFSIGAKAKLNSAGTVNVSGSSAFSFGDKLKLTAGGSITASSGGNRNFGTGAKITSGGPYVDNGGGTSTYGDKTKIVAESVSIFPATALLAGAKFSATTTVGPVSFGGGGLVSFGEGAKISGEAVNLGGTEIAIAEGGSFDAGTSALSISTSGPVNAGESCNFAGSGVNLSNGSDQNYGEKCVIDARDGVLGGSSPTIMSFGNGCTLMASGIGLGGNSTVFGEKCKVISTTGSLTFSGSADQTFGDGTRVDAAGSFVVGTPGNISVGDKCKIRAPLIQIGSGAAVSIGERTSLEATSGDITLDGTAAVTIGEKCKLDAAGAISMNGDDLTIDPGAKLSAAAALDSIEFTADNAIDIMDAKMKAQDINVGYGPLVNPFLFQSVLVQGDGGPATIDFTNPSGNCDVTGSSFKNITETYNCMSVTGP